MNFKDIMMYALGIVYIVGLCIEFGTFMDDDIKSDCGKFNPC